MLKLVIMYFQPNAFLKAGVHSSLVQLKKMALSGSVAHAIVIESSRV
jgi:hypothetical protein